MNKEKAWALLGHSSLSTPAVKRVPNGVTLVLLAKCGRQFNVNNRFRRIFKNDKKITRYLAHNKSKNVYTSGNKYTNQIVYLESNNTMPHGLVTLPMNIRAIHNHNTFVRGSVKISNAINIVKNRGGGILFGMFCRGTPGVRKTVSGLKTFLPGKKSQMVFRKGNMVNNGTMYKEIMNVRHIMKKKTVKPSKHKYTRKTINRPVLNYGNL